MKKTWLIISAAGLWMVVFILAACTPSDASQDGDLTGRVWVLTELNGKPPMAGTGISAQFSADGKVMGSAGCNRYNGSFTISGENITFSSPLASTMMMCEQAIMDQESAYLQALAEVKTFSLTGNLLTFRGEEGANLLVFQAQSQDLANTDWQATFYNNGSQAVVGVLEGSSLTASFAEGDNLSGNSGCNSYNGSYKVDGNQITIGPLASTMKFCDEPAGVMEQEAQFLAALQSAASFQVEGNVLELRTQDGALAGLFTKK